MNLLALLLGLAIEHWLTNVFHLREFHWLDPLIDRYFSRTEHAGSAVSILWGVILLIVLVLPVALLHALLLTQLGLIAAFVFSVFVLLFCLGPRDLADEVAAFRRAVEEDDQDELQVLACELLERPVDTEGSIPDIEKAVFSQANNRIFGVVFWFALLGPSGAWLFRVVDLMRKRAVRHAAESTPPEPRVEALLLQHRILAWLPSRLLMAGYAMAGNYDAAVQAWRREREPVPDALPDPDAELLGEVGCAAVTSDPDADESDRAQTAMDLVARTLWFIWCPVLALLTIYGALA